MKIKECVPGSGDTTEMWYILSACLVFCGAGALLAWPAAALPRLTAPVRPNATQPPLSPDQAPWVVAALHAGQILGAGLGALLASRIGRRAALLLCAPPMVGAWLLLALVGDGGDGGGDVMALVVTARALGGIAVGAALSAGPLYAVEAASARKRGAAGAMVVFALSAGQLFVYCGGLYLSLRVLALAAAVLPVLFVVAFWRSPESPHWLLHRRCLESAERALRTLRGSKATKEQIRAEVNALEASTLSDTSTVKQDAITMSVRKRKSTDNGGVSTASDGSPTNEVEGSLNDNNSTETIRDVTQPDLIKEARRNTETEDSKEITPPKNERKTLKSYLKDITFRRVLRFVSILILLQNFGTSCFLFPYCTHVLDDAPLSLEIGFVVLGVVQVVGALLSSWLLGSVGRRPALLASAGVAGLALAARVICLHLLPSPTTALVLLVLAAFANSLAFACLPMLCAAELTPAPARSATVATAVALFAAGSYGSVTACEALWNADLPHVASFVNAAACGAAAWMTAQMPEARGLSLSQVQQGMEASFSGPTPLAEQQRSAEGSDRPSEQPAPERRVAFQVRFWKFSLFFMRDVEVKVETEERNTSSEIEQDTREAKDN